MTAMVGARLLGFTFRFLGFGARSVTIPADALLLGSHSVAVAPQTRTSDLTSE
jgi:hypothetical protein